jgi:hypothetical protein
MTPNDTFLRENRKAVCYISKIWRKLGGATLLLLDEPTDNLDLPSADALQTGLESCQGTVLAVTTAGSPRHSTASWSWTPTAR